MWSAVESSLNLDDAFLDNELDPRHGMTTWAKWHETKDYNQNPANLRSLLQGWQDTLGDVFTC